MLLSEMFVKEAHPISYAIHLDKIPQKYRQFKVIGRGATSIVLDYDEDEVLILTKDNMKREWLQHSDLGTVIDTFMSYNKDSREISEMPVYVIKTSKLFPLSKENKKKVNKLMFILRKHFEYGRYSKKQMYEFFNYAIERLELEFPDEENVIEFINFIMNYDENQFNFDIFPRNFMENKDGKIIANDLVVDGELFKYLLKIRQNKETLRLQNNLWR